MIKAGLSSWAFAWNIGVSGYQKPSTLMTLEMLIQKAVELKADVLQIADNINYTHIEFTSAVKTAEKHNLEIELGTKGTSNLEKIIELAYQNNIKLIRTLPHNDHDIPTINELTKRLGSASKILEKYGIKLALENHDHYQAAHLLEAVKNADSPYIGICYDPANNYGQGEGYLKCAQILAPYVINVHYKDFIIKRMPHMMGFTIEGVPAGSGLIEYEKLKALFNHNLSWIVELWTPWQGSISKTATLEMDFALQSINFLKSRQKGI